MDLIRNTNLPDKIFSPSVFVKRGFRKFTEYRDFWCNLFLGAWLEKQKTKNKKPKPQDLTKSGDFCCLGDKGAANNVIKTTARCYACLF